MKVALTMSMVALCFILSSCAKDYTCECTATDNITGMSVSSSVTDQFNSKSAAKEWCDDAVATNGVSTASCVLK